MLRMDIATLRVPLHFVGFAMIFGRDEVEREEEHYDDAISISSATSGCKHCSCPGFSETCFAAVDEIDNFDDNSRPNAIAIETHDHL